MVKGFAMGQWVVLAEEYVALVERPDLRNVIHEVVDSRGANGVVAYRVAPLMGRGIDWARQSEVFADDLRAVQGVR